MDEAAIDRIFDPGYSVNDSPVGRGGVKQAVRALHAAFSPISVTVDELVAEDDRVAVRWTMRGVHSGLFMDFEPTGKEVQLSGINVYRVAGGKIASNHEQTSMQDLLRQLGVAKRLGSFRPGDSDRRWR